MNTIDHDPQAPFTPQQVLTLQQLHARYQEDNDYFSDRERTHLQFVRWLLKSGRITSPPKIDPPATTRPE